MGTGFSKSFGAPRAAVTSPLRSYLCLEASASIIRLFGGSICDRWSAWTWSALAVGEVWDVGLGGRPLEENFPMAIGRLREKTESEGKKLDEE